MSKFWILSLPRSGTYYVHVNIHRTGAYNTCTFTGFSTHIDLLRIYARISVRDFHYWFAFQYMFGYACTAYVYGFIIPLPYYPIRIFPVFAFRIHLPVASTQHPASHDALWKWAGAVLSPYVAIPSSHTHVATCQQFEEIFLSTPYTSIL